MSIRIVTAALLATFAVACDNRQAFHEPDPTLARMLQQRRGDPYAASGVFADGKVMRDPPPGAIARDEADPAAAPPPATPERVHRGRARFEVVCATCHGMSGDGASVVATKMRSRPPASLHEDRIRALTDQGIFDVVTHGYGMMPSYAEMLDAEDRWAVVYYVRALQLSQRATVATLPPPVAAALAKEAP